jgi:hypothetical protein
MLVIRAITLNGVAGSAFGWLYWHCGLESAMLSHFCTDIFLHVVGPMHSEAKNKEAQPKSK